MYLGFRLNRNIKLVILAMLYGCPFPLPLTLTIKMTARYSVNTDKQQGATRRTNVIEGNANLYICGTSNSYYE